MKKGQCKDALEIYKRFLTRMTRVSEFLKVAEVSGPDFVAKVIGTRAQHSVWVDNTPSTCPGYMRMRGQLRVPSPTPASHLDAVKQNLHGLWGHCWSTDWPSPPSHLMTILLLVYCKKKKCCILNPTFGFRKFYPLWIRYKSWVLISLILSMP